MKIIRNSIKVSVNYAIALIVFVVFIYPLIGITKDNFSKWLPLYSVLLFLFAFFVIYGDMKSLAIKEKRPQYNLNPYPLKGLVYGLIGTIPVALPVAVASMIRLENDIAELVKHKAINAFLGPVYFLVRWLGGTPIAYAAAILLLPLTAMLGYLAGYYGINVMDKLRKKKPESYEKKFSKSPWNPTNVPDKPARKKKAKTGKL